MANLDALLKISAQVIGTDRVERLAQSLGNVEKGAQGVKGAFKGIIDSSAWQGAAAAAAGFTLAMGLSVRAAISFEEKMADVRKVVQGIETPAAFREIQQEIINLSRTMPIAAEGFAEIYAAAGQSGIAREEIKQFAIDVGRMGIAFDMTAQEAGNAMAKLRSSLGIGQQEVVLLADALNHLSNNTAATAAQLTEFTLRSGAVGQTAGLSAEKTAAFGAAMVSAGIETEVAATSFNNLIKALTRGDSMTERQTIALQRLGIVGAGAVVKGERDMTAEVERQGRRRLDAIRDESDRQLSELNRRYRRQLQLLEDQWDDEADRFQDGIDKRQAAEIKALQQASEARVRAMEQQYGDDKAAADRAIQLERDKTDAQIEAIRDRDEAILKQERRAARDRQEVVRQQMEDELDAKRKAKEKETTQLREMEEESMKQAVAAAKKMAEEGGASAGAGLARRMQENALGTIMDIFKRIKGLPQEMQLSVISDLFGDEARGLTPLIQNMGTLEKALGLVGDQTNYAGSMLAEYNTRSDTAANKLQLAQNNFKALQIEIGEKMVPALVKLLQFITPVVEGFSKFAAAHPGITAVAVGITAVVAAIVIALPFIASVVTAIGTLAPLLGSAGLGGALAWIAGALGAVGPALASVGSALGALGTAIAAFITWPVLLGAAIVAAIAAIWIFRDDIAKFFQEVADLAVYMVDNMGETLAYVGEIWQNIFSGLAEFAMEAFNATLEFAQTAFAAMLETFYTVWVEPYVKAWEALQKVGADLIGGLQKNWGAFSTWVQGIFKGIGTAFRTFISDPLSKAWQAIVDTGKAALNGLMGWAVSAINAVIRATNKLIDGINAVRKLVGLSSFGKIGEVSVPKFAAGGFVDGATLGVVGEAGPEYIIPEGKAAAFAQNFLNGARGPAAIPSSGSASTTAGPVTVNLTTGPVLQQPDGTQALALEDVERLVRQGVAETMRQLRTPGGRYAMGVR